MCVSALLFNPSIVVFDLLFMLSQIKSVNINTQNTFNEFCWNNVHMAQLNIVIPV